MSRTIVTSKRPVWITLLTALVIHAGLMSVQVGHRIDTGFLRGWLLGGLAPLEKLADSSVYGIGHIWDTYFTIIGVHEENKQLKGQLDDLRMQIERQREDVSEAGRLRTLLALKDAGLGKTVVARVIGRDPTRANQTVTIDKGLSQGVKPDSAVITPEGVIGRVIHSSHFYSIVQLIVDSQSGIGVMLQSSRQQGILKGTGGAELELDYIEDDNDLKQGQPFITSGLDRIYPKGLPVGIISSIGPRRGLFKTVQVRPAADLHRLEEVICIIERPQEVDVLDPTQSIPSP